MGEAKRRGNKEERVKQAQLKKFGRGKNTCIICRKNKKKDELTDEHVIPDAINGHYHIKCVCKKCNSNLGNSVDSFLINHQLTDLYRFANLMSGKGSKVPNPFKGVFFHPINPDLKYKFRVNKDNELEPYQVPYKSEILDEDGKIQSFKIITDARDKKQAEQALNKILNRNKISRDSVEISSSSELIDNKIPFTGQLEIELKNFKIGLLKIAYEFAVDKIPEYYLDPLAIEISGILESCDLNKLDDIKMGTGFDSSLFNELDNFFISKNRHLLFLLTINDELICFIKLDNFFAIPIRLSEKSYMDFFNSIVLINLIDSTTTEKLICDTLLNLMNGNSGFISNKFQYIEEGKNLLDEQSAINYLCSNNDIHKPILFNEKGKVLLLDFEKFLRNNSLLKHEIKDGNNIVNFRFITDRSIFIKNKNDGRLIKINAYEQIKKIIKI